MERGWVKVLDRSVIFFADVRKTLIRLRLRCVDLVTSRQNIETKVVAGKVFQEKELGRDATW
jgi:hypothetical protein